MKIINKLKPKFEQRETMKLRATRSYQMVICKPYQNFKTVIKQINLPYGRRIRNKLTWTSNSHSQTQSWLKTYSLSYISLLFLFLNSWGISGVKKLIRYNFTVNSCIVFILLFLNFIRPPGNDDSYSFYQWNSIDSGTLLLAFL